MPWGSEIESANDPWKIAIDEIGKMSLGVVVEIMGRIKGRF